MEEILQLLADDARLTPAQIAERTGRPEAEVKTAVAKLEKDGVIRRYKTVVDWDKAGVEHVFGFIEVRVSPERGVGFDSVAERIVGFPEVHSLYLMSGTYDLLVVVQGKTMREVAYFVAERLAPLDHVLSTATHFVLKRYKVDGDVMEERSENKRLPVTP
ncbi:MAG: Lrp/AsnC family transcriptional regulator [Armatimonadota bacterium]|jgi:DNA-binding Lrp family transcriptional regulator|nr:MAG: Lrp/AsnC family transcriptional regulator [Armatimonadota bacterium]